MVCSFAKRGLKHFHFAVSEMESSVSLNLENYFVSFFLIKLKI